jgi:RsiW-degrading membrane proteinase PrsW (M82 family)
MLAATVYGVIQLLVLAWPTRTVRLPTALLAVAVGVYACGALTVVLELASAHTLSSLLDIPVADAVKRASYTVDPVIEELVKVAPLLLVGINVRSRLQHGLTDYVVLGAALGAGFGLLEAVARFGMDADQAVPIAGGGWILPNLTPPYIPGIKQVLSTAFPAPVGSLDIADLTKLATGLSSGTSIHLTWTALAGLGVGLLLRSRSWMRLLGLLPLGLACGLHALHNFVAVNPESAAEPFTSGLETVLWLVPLISLAIAMALDLKTLHRAKSAVPTPSVRRFSLIAFPWTAWIVLRFILVRRSLWFLAARSTPAAAEPMQRVVGEILTEMHAAGNRQAWRGLGVLSAIGGWKRRVLLAIIWLALMIPALLLAVVGSFPSRAGLQESLSTGTGAKIMLGFAAAALVWILWRLIAAVLEVRRTAASPVGETIAAARLRVLVALGALSIGTALLYLPLTGTQLDDRLPLNAHLLDALDDFLLVLGVTLTILALAALFPPGGLALATGGVVAGGLSLEAATALGLSGILLMTAGANGRRSGSSTSAGSSGGARKEPAGVEQRDPAPKPVVSSRKLQNIVDELWHGHDSPKRTGDGTTMDAVRNEIKTGRPTQGVWHTDKAIRLRASLRRWLKANPDAPRRERFIANDLINRITNALNTRKPG